MKAYEAVIRLINSYDVETVFTLMSDGIMDLISEIEDDWDDEIEVIKARHEDGAVGMADGHSRILGDVSVCIVGRGPAAAHVATSMIMARKNGSKVLLLAAEPALEGFYHTKDFEQTSFLETVAGEVVSIRSPENFVKKFNHAIHHVVMGDGPLAVQVPMDVMEGEVEDTASLKPLVTELSEGRSVIQPDGESLSKAAELLTSSGTPPVILAGRGAVHAGAREQLVALADEVGGMLATTLQGKGFFDRHPRSLGIVGGLGSETANAHVRASRCLLAVGASLNPFTTHDDTLLHDDLTVIHVDNEQRHIGRFSPVDLGIVGDASEAVEGILNRVADTDLDREGAPTIEEPNRPEADLPSTDGVVNPHQLFKSLDETLADDRLVIGDVGHFISWVLDYISVGHPDDFIWAADFSALGKGIPVGIGAALANEEKVCYTFCGDAGFVMSIPELETAVRHEVPITVVIVNDGVLGAEYHELVRDGQYADSAVVLPPDLAGVAESIGADSHVVSSVADVEALRETLNQLPDRPTVIDCRVDRDVPHRSKQ